MEILNPVEQNYVQNNQNMINSVYSPGYYYLLPYSNNVLGQTVNNTMSLQENINPNNLTDVEKSNLSTKPKKSENNLNNSSKDIMPKTSKVEQKINLSKSERKISTQNIKKKLESSGVLVKSTRAPKYNRVIKNGKKIKNIDINNDCEDTMKDEDSVSSLPIKDKKKSNDGPLIMNAKINSEVQPKQTIKTKQKEINSEKPEKKDLETNSKTNLKPEKTIKKVKTIILPEKLKEPNFDKFDKFSKNNETNDTKSRKSSGSAQSKPPLKNLAVK